MTDIEAGARAGCRTIFVGRWKCENCQFIQPHDLRPDFVARDLWEAVQLICSDLSTRAERLEAPAHCRPRKAAAV